MQRNKRNSGWGEIVISGLFILVFLGATFSCTPGVDVKKQKQMADAWKLGQVYMQQREYTKALRQFLAAEQFYRQAAADSSDNDTARIAAQFATEEQSHAEELERMLAALPANGAHLREEDDDPHMPE